MLRQDEDRKICVVKRDEDSFMVRHDGNKTDLCGKTR